MLKFGEWIARHRALILIFGIVLLLPSALGYVNTRVNYDILSYLPKDINTMVGQDILKDEFKSVKEAVAALFIGERIGHDAVAVKVVIHKLRVFGECLNSRLTAVAEEFHNQFVRCCTAVGVLKAADHPGLVGEKAG